MGSPINRLMNVEVRQWIRSLSIPRLNVTAQIVSDGSSEYCSNPRSNTCVQVDRKKDPASLGLDLTIP
jgi:hypothetical protein